ncbi:MAG: hypothetical protein M0001_03830 [Treponema sp.]|nr:hypothetical protein [Treponema sp.]
MKRQLVAIMLSSALAGGAFAASISLTPPQISSWNVTVGGLTQSVPAATIATFNTTLGSMFTSLQTSLNSSTLSNFGNLPLLSQGFANANSAAFDNASLLAFQTYDLFGLMIGSNVSVAAPSVNPNDAMKAFTDIQTKGDIYLGMATGGVAGQFGLNTSLFIPHVYLSGKFGFIPSYTYTSGSTSVSFQQMMLGVGVNYTIFNKFDLLFGFFKWRGLSFGTGLTYNSNTTGLSMAIAPMSAPPQTFSTGIAGVNPTVTASLQNIKATLTVNDSSIVIPLELMTSLQVLWFLNVGVGGGVDVAFSNSKIAAGGQSDVIVSGLDTVGAVVTPGSATVTVVDSKATGAVFIPRLAASLGLNLAIVKIEVPVSYYPTTQAAAVGVNVGIVW